MEYFQDMLEHNHQLFTRFETVHAEYTLNPQKYQEAFNVQGEEILAVIRKYENLLCGKSESGKYGKFSSNLSDKFWQAVRGKFPKIDFVGVK